jgi:hypothetical protein
LRSFLNTVGFIYTISRTSPTSGTGILRACR